MTRTFSKNFYQLIYSSSVYQINLYAFFLSYKAEFG